MLQGYERRHETFAVAVMAMIVAVAEATSMAVANVVEAKPMAAAAAAVEAIPMAAAAVVKAIYGGDCCCSGMYQHVGGVSGTGGYKRDCPFSPLQAAFSAVVVASAKR